MVVFRRMQVRKKVIRLDRVREEFVQKPAKHFVSWIFDLAIPDVFRDSIIIRVPRALWPDEELTKILSLLGPDFSIKVDPESIL